MTTKPYYVYSIRSQWRGRIETPVAIGAKFVNMLDALSGIDPIFSDWLSLISRIRVLEMQQSIS